MYGNSGLIYVTGAKSNERIDETFGLRQTAARRFWRFFAGGFWRRLRSAFGRQSGSLLSLKQVAQGMVLEGARQLGTMTVPLDQIKGSEDKSCDFDSEFRPLKSFIRERWICIAVAHLQGRNLPPVELIKLGDDYFVRDGHHRISVARAFGQMDIDAVVTTWDVRAAN